MRHIPNTLTVVRILLTPVVLVLLTVPALWAQAGATALFMLASASDYYDGKLAREMNLHSRLGQFLDPLADKILVIGTFATLAFLEPGIIPLWAVAAIVLRDLAVTGARSWAESRGRSLRTLTVAKWKTLFQMAFLFIVMVLRTLTLTAGPARRGAEWLLHGSPVMYVLLLAVVAFTVITGAMYLIMPQSETAS